MIAVDTSSLRRFLEGRSARDVEQVALALESRQLALPPVVLTEILSEPSLQRQTIEAISGLPLLEIDGEFWARAGLLRSGVLAQGRKCKVADALIAQACLDHRVPLITNDRDFRIFEDAGLLLVPGRSTL